MVNTSEAPAFGQADLTNCERELIHLAGSVQDHGALLVLSEPAMAVLQASANVARVLGPAFAVAWGRPLAAFGGDLAAQIDVLQRTVDLTERVMLHATVGPDGLSVDVALHRVAGVGLVAELERSPQAASQSTASHPSDSLAVVQDLPAEILTASLAAAVARFGAAPTVGVLADAIVQVMRDLTGYDRVVVYKFDPDGHGKVIAEALHPRLEPLLGHHYPAGDIPQRARALYVLNRIRTLVNVEAPAAPLLLPPGAAAQAPLDMSHCQLRSMSPIHLQYLRNMGVTATMSASLVRDGQLWGLVAAHHYAPRQLRCTVRAAVELLAEVAATRLSAIENYAHAQVALMVRRLEQRLVEATSTEGDWRYALFRNPRNILQPLEATGAALFCEGEILTCGQSPSTPELDALLAWVQSQARDGLYACSAIGQANPNLSSLTPTASGVLAVRLSTNSPDWLIWFRKEQLQSITWAGDPVKVMVANNPLELTPRRSFAAWSAIVRGTAVPWSSTELALAQAIGVALIDIIVQVHAVRLLIAEHQLGKIRATVAGSREPVAVADSEGRVLFLNDALLTLIGSPATPPASLADLFTDAVGVRQQLEHLRSTQRGWRHELNLAVEGAAPLPVAVHAEWVAGRDGKPLGLVLTLADLRELRRTESARSHLETALQETAERSEADADAVIAAILSNASVAAMDFADVRGGAPIAPLLMELETSTQRAAALYGQIRSFLRPGIHD